MHSYLLYENIFSDEIPIPDGLQAYRAVTGKHDICVRSQGKACFYMYSAFQLLFKLGKVCKGVKSN